MYFRDELLRIKKEMEERCNNLGKELKELPDSELYYRDQHGNRYYYARLKKEGNRKKERRFGISKDYQMLELLVRKKYVELAIAIVNKNIEIVKDAIERYEPADEDSVMEGFLADNPKLNGTFHYEKDTLDDWANSYYEESDYHTENLKSTASDGTKRRSKGEILIGTKLNHYKIPYRYEAPAHPDLPYIPDFTVRRPRDGKLFYWEHLGKVNDSEYMNANRLKFDAYEEVGIVPWNNLIITYDQADGGINEKLIDAMIQAWLL